MNQIFDHIVNITMHLLDI